MARFAIRCWAALLLLAITAGAAPAQTPGPTSPEPPAAPAQVKALLNLLADPQVRDWLEKQKPAAASPADPKPESEAPQTAGGFASARLHAIRAHLKAIGEAAPRLPTELTEAGRILYLEFEDQGLLEIGLLLTGFVALGFGLQGLFRWSTRGTLGWIVALPLDSVGDRLRAVLIRLGYGIGILLSFALGSVGAFLVFTWPPLVRDILLGYLMAFLAIRLTMVLSRFLLAPGGERFRILPMTTVAAWFWHRRVTLLVAWFVLWYVSLDLLRILGLPQPSAQVLAYIAGLGLLAIGLAMVWRRPLGPGQERGGADWLVSGYFGLLWLLWVVSSMPLFWLLVVAVGLPFAIRTTQRAVNHLLRPPGSEESSDGTQRNAIPSLTAICLERGLRAAWIIAAVLLLAHVWGVHWGDLTAQDTIVTRLLRGLISAVVVVLIADLVWNLARASIDCKLQEAMAAGIGDGEEAHRRARLRTLLPILRNMLFVVLAAMAVLMALSAMGVEIGPLIAGAGVVGVAVGFGAQTLVKDIISGIFYLTDDAFRVGEYIQSGNYKGTVESFSLRSVKLRHHRGPLYTVPFGSLGAVQNMSRDWVIDKLMVGITYDSDLEKAKKLIKQIGKELVQDPEFGRHIIEPMKMQGVEQFGEFAIQIRMKMMTKPGEQFTIRRRALAMIKKAFDANGIKFASPTVQVSGGAPGDPATVAAAAAARQATAGREAAAAAEGAAT